MRILFSVFILFTFGFSEFIKSENIVIDKQRNLMWQDNIEVTYEEDIIMGNVYCEELILNGYIDWKLPTIKQLQTLIDQEGKQNYLNKVFEFVQEGDYYSNTKNISKYKEYWYINYKTGLISTKHRSMLGHIRCVREIK